MLLCVVLCFTLGSEAKTCKWYSKTYMTFYCTIDKCAQACKNEGFDGAECDMVGFNPIMIQCICKKPC
jgi:hypothetical protein